MFVGGSSDVRAASDPVSSVSDLTLLVPVRSPAGPLVRKPVAFHHSLSPPCPPPADARWRPKPAGPMLGARRLSRVVAG